MNDYIYDEVVDRFIQTLNSDGGEEAKNFPMLIHMGSTPHGFVAVFNRSTNRWELLVRRIRLYIKDDVDGAVRPLEGFYP